MLFALLLCSMAAPATPTAPAMGAVPFVPDACHWLEIATGVILTLKFPEIAVWMNHICSPSVLQQDAAPIVVAADAVVVSENPVA